MLLLSRYLDPMRLVIFASIAVAVLPFQPLKTNGVGQHGMRRRNSGVDYMGRASFPSSPTLSSPCRISETFLHLSTDPIQQQQKRTPGTEVKSRDMASLSEWSRSCEIVLADGIELSEDLLGDWSLTTTKSIEQGNSILTVPSQVILTSDINGDSYLPYYNETDMQNIRDWMESELESGSQSKQDYLPEYMLVYKLLREVHMGTSSRWYPWLQSLPTEFSTGLFLDEVERNYVERMTGDYIKVQELQYQACLKLFQKLVNSQESKEKKSLVPTELLTWMLALQQDGDNEEDTNFDNLVKWAFTIVFTRSWRSPDRKQAQIVPVGDLANHDSQFANLKPGFRQTDGALQFFVTDDIDVVGPTSPKLYLSYGLTYSPARYLVIFGFCDVTAAYIDARLDFLPTNDDCKWPTTLDPSQLVVSTLNGALSEEVWIAFLYKILQDKDPELLARIRKAFEDNNDRGDRLVEEVLETWEFEVGKEIQAYYQQMLETDFTPITVAERDFSEHPNLSMIVNYNLFMRETYLNVLEHVNEFLTQCIEFQELSAPRGENKIDVETPKPKENSTIDSNLNSSQQLNRTLVPSSRSDSVVMKSESKSYESASAQLVSSEPSNKDSKNTEEINSLPSKSSTEVTTSAQKVQESISPNGPSSFSSFDPESYSVQESPEVIDLNKKSEMDRSETDQLPYTQGDTSQVGSNLNATSKFSAENFSLQSYSNTPESYNSSFYEQSYAPGEIAQTDIYQQSSPNIPTGNFNPQFLPFSVGKTQENIDSTGASGMPYGNIESQSYSDAPPNFDSTSMPAFNYENPNLPFYPNVETTQEPMTDFAKSSGFPTTDVDSQPYSPSQDRIESNAAPQFDYGNSNLQTYGNGDVTPTNEQIYWSTTSGSPNNENTDLQSYSDSQTIPTQERISLNASSVFPTTNRDSYSNSSGETTSAMNERISSTATDKGSQSSINQTGASEVGVDYMKSYAQSLVLDQRGESGVQQQSDGGAQPLKQNNSDISSTTPTTYAEYTQQRQEEPFFPSDGYIND